MCADWAMQHAHIRQQHQQQQCLQTIAIYIQRDAERKDTFEHSVDMHALNYRLKFEIAKLLKFDIRFETCLIFSLNHVTVNIRSSTMVISSNILSLITESSVFKIELEISRKSPTLHRFDGSA